jgi:hypothetical protein
VGVQYRKRTTHEAGTEQGLPPVTVGVLEGSEFYDLGGGVSVPSSFLMRFEDAAVEGQIVVNVNEDGSARCTSLTITHKDGAAIDWRTLRRFPMERLVDVGRTLVLRHTDAEGRTFDVGTGPPSEARDTFLRHMRQGAISRPGGRRRKPDDEIRQVAAIYKAAGAKPILALEEAFPNYTRSTLNTWVARARELGYLPPATYRRTQP